MAASTSAASSCTWFACGFAAALLLNGTLAALPRDLNITVAQGVVTHLPPTFRAELPEALEEFLSASGSRYVPGFTTGLEEVFHQQLLGLAFLWFVCCLHFSTCACHPCAGAMLIFSLWL